MNYGNKKENSKKIKKKFYFSKVFYRIKNMPRNKLSNSKNLRIIFLKKKSLFLG